jgi:hypothetical protein
MLQTAILAVFTASGLGELSAQESTGDPGSETLEYELLTQAEIETLVAPVALYPDTLLIQIFVAATQPFELVKADRFLLENSEVDAEALKPEIEAQGWDPSVEVLAIGFPDVIADMAQHIEWTEAMGDAMNAQTDDVMNAVQTLRQQAVNTGALVSGEQQTVDVDEDENIIVQPTDPEVVYVPQYDPVVVYEDSSSNLLTAAAVTFGSVLLIDAIFDDDDDWNGYWGCRNCGWGGGGIYPYPGGGIDIDVDGNVNIGNDINIGGGDRDRPGDGSWRPKPETRDEAREKISQKREPGGDTKLPINKSDTNSDALRAKLSGRAGAPDISRPNASRRTGDAGGPQLQRPGNGASRDLPQVNRPSGQPSDIKRDAIAGTGTDRSRINGTTSVRSDSARPAQVTRPQQPKKPSAATGPSTKKKPTAIKKQGSGRQAAAASRRGGGKGGGARVGRR